MSNLPRSLPLHAFLRHFSNNVEKGNKYCFILGAGASVQSGIPTGGQLAKKWLKEIEEIYGERHTAEWMIAASVAADNPAVSYSSIYEKRFEIDPTEGYMELQTLMDKKDPSIGYSVLAQIMDQHNHRIVITTNFDSLTEDSLFIYTQTKPLMVGHESLANYINPTLNRPMVVKIHRDLFFDPKNEGAQISKMAQKFEVALRDIFKYYTPLVIGYGGNDGSLMGFLEKLDSMPGRPVWFHRGKADKLNDRIKSLINKFSGFTVSIDGFDEMMLELGDKMQLERMDQKLVDIARNRAEAYREQINQILGHKTTIYSKNKEEITGEKTRGLEMHKSTPETTKQAVKNMIERGTEDWLSYEIKAANEMDPAKKESIYQEGLEKYPNSIELRTNYGLFLNDVAGEHKKAIEQYEQVIAIKEDYDVVWNNLGKVYHDLRNFKQAIQCLQKATTFNPNNDLAWNNMGASYYALGEKEKAKELYRKALEVNPNSDQSWYNLGILLADQGQNEKAIEAYEKAAEINPDDPNIWYNLGGVYDEVKNYSRAIASYQRGLEIAPEADNLWTNMGFTSFKNMQLEEAKTYTEKGIELGNQIQAQVNLGHIHLAKQDEKAALGAYLVGLKNFSDPQYFWKGIEEDFPYLEKYGIERKYFDAVKLKIEKAS